MYTKPRLPTTALKHKHLKLDQRKIDFARRYFGVKSEQEAIDRALSLLMEEERIVEKMRPLAGALRADDRAWPIGATVVTSNERDFQQIARHLRGLRWEIPLT